MNNNQLATNWGKFPWIRNTFSDAFRATTPEDLARQLYFWEQGQLNNVYDIATVVRKIFTISEKDLMVELLDGTQIFRFTQLRDYNPQLVFIVPSASSKLGAATLCKRKLFDKLAEKQLLDKAIERYRRDGVILCYCKFAGIASKPLIMRMGAAGDLRGFGMFVSKEPYEPLDVNLADPDAVGYLFQPLEEYLRSSFQKVL